MGYETIYELQSREVIMLAVKNYKFWFCTGSQDLYGDECLANVAAHSKEIVAKLNESSI